MTSESINANAGSTSVSSPIVASAATPRLDNPSPRSVGAASRRFPDSWPAVRNERKCRPFCVRHVDKSPIQSGRLPSKGRRPRFDRRTLWSRGCQTDRFGWHMVYLRQGRSLEAAPRGGTSAADYALLSIARSRNVGVGGAASAHVCSIFASTLLRFV